MTHYGPFAERTPGQQEGWVHGLFRTIPQHLRMMLGHLDGVEGFTYLIWRGDDPSSIVGFGDTKSDSFMQAAGSAESMTVEVRLPGPDGAGHLYAVGRSVEPTGTVLIPISPERAVRVGTNEVFTADEAALIFYTFTLTDAVAQPYVLRELDLSKELSEKR